jgi:hypothetical protein
VGGGARTTYVHSIERIGGPRTRRLRASAAPGGIGSFSIIKCVRPVLHALPPPTQRHGMQESRGGVQISEEGTVDQCFEIRSPVVACSSRSSNPAHWARSSTSSGARTDLVFVSNPESDTANPRSIKSPRQALGSNHRITIRDSCRRAPP